jgi:hypothetical protein
MQFPIRHVPLASAQYLPALEQVFGHGSPQPSSPQALPEQSGTHASQLR